MNLGYNGGDDSAYSVVGFDPTVMLPDEDVYKPKKKIPAKKKVRKLYGR